MFPLYALPLKVLDDNHAPQLYKEKNNELTLGSLYFILAILASSFVHNLIYFFFYIRPTEMTFWSFFFRYGIASTLYTTVAALFPMLVKSRNVQN